MCGGGVDDIRLVVWYTIVIEVKKSVGGIGMGNFRLLDFGNFSTAVNS